MPIDLVSTARHAADLLFALDLQTNTFDDSDWHNQSKIEEAVLDIDGIVCALIASTEGHGRREQFKSTVSVAHGAMVPTHLGDISVAISGKAARRVNSVQYIERRRANAAGFTLVKPQYVLDENNVIWHTGATNASVTLFNFSRGAAPQAPDEYRPALIYGTVAARMPKDGVKVQAAEYYKSMWQLCLEMISAGAKSLPPVEAYEGE